MASGKDSGKEVFKKFASLIFKKIQVVRFYDRKRSALVYFTYSDRIIEGAPKNSISTIAPAQAIQGGTGAALGN